MRLWMSRSAVSCEHFASVAHFVVVSLPVEAVEQAIQHERAADR